MNITSLYVTILLPITLAYINKQYKETGRKEVKPLFFLIFLMFVSHFKSDGFWRVMEFNMRRFFMLW